ncbi:Protocadherin-16 [Toxocara canis]|uniref:Protocadherin-16 n=1 Tax=Toxocara canis TaxID=6265 RepID=A0A0B2UXV5_TOXCA|nr:Protocadherin-16 [Toxocara canis]
MSATSKCKVLVSGIDRIEVLERIRGARVLVVRYGGHSGTALVNVHVEDVNDNSPIFYPADYNVSVREDAPIGSPLLVLSANDADQGAYGQVRYRIVSGGSDAFRLEPQTGYLYVQNRLTKKSYDVVVQAQDGGGLISERKANVHVSVITPSTPTPQFTSNLYTFMAAEDVLPGISIGQVEATGPFPISYTIYSGDPDHLFTIERTTGKITVSRYLDADKWGSILLNIQAWMEGGGANHTQVVIELADANDNEPRFEMERVEAYVAEDQPVHVPFFAVQATDKDRGQNGEITYSLVYSEPPCPVTVRPLTGELALSASLDYETTRRYDLVIKARDHGIPPRSSNITVTVNVVDINDNAPQFDVQLYGVEVAEDVAPMTEIVTVRAKDADSEKSAKINFRFADEIPEFGIHPHSGSVFVKTALDRERAAEYRIVIIATDSGQPPLSSNATLHISVLDVNDNSPNCSTVAPLTLSDDTSAGETFGTINAIDPDHGTNGTVTYRIQNEDPYFAVKSNGEVVLKRKVSQLGSAKEYRLSVIASDGGVDKRSAVCQARIIVERVQSKVKFVEPIDRKIRLNENCLSECRLVKLNASDVARWEIETNEISRFFVISRNTLRTSSIFDENFFKMSRLLSVSAYDSDGRKRQIIFTVLPMERRSSSSDNSTIFLRLSRNVPVGTKLITIGKPSKETFWRLINETNDVQLDEVTSALYSTSNFALLNESSLALSVTRTSLPDYSQERFTVFIEIEQENVHGPVFRRCPVSVTIREGEQVGSMVAKMEAVDADWGMEGQIAYRISDSSSPFSIDPVSGDVFLTHTPDWSKERSMFAVVEAEDRAQEIDRRKQSTCVLFVSVEDVNNNAPHFLSATNISVSEESSSNGIVHYVVAKDEDDGENARISYTIVTGNHDGAFSLDPSTGALSLHHRLRAHTTIRVRATDNGEVPKFTEQDLNIYVASSRRQWEYFPQSKYTFSVHKEAPPGTLVHDFYGNSFERPRLKLLSNFVSGTEIFTISDDGKLLTTAQLAENDYTVVVLAVNAANRSDWATVKVHRVNGNQNPPRIASTSCGNLTVPENTQISHLTRIFAVDNDEGTDAVVQFNIVAGNENNVFSIDKFTGILSCRELDREQKSEYFLVITAEDHGIPARADTCTIRITVADDNDNPPLFSENTPDYVEINDSTPVGTILARVFAKDSDAGSNGKVIYSIVEDKSGLLDIRDETGEIFFARDHPTKHNEFSVRVRAEDEGNSRVLYAERLIRLALKRSKSEWDAPQPSFLSQRYTGVVKEGQLKGQLVLQISSSERLYGDAPLTYSIVSGNVDAAFEVDNEGRITTTQELDREIEHEYLLKVVANGHYRTVPETAVRIRVLNLNDNVPSLPLLRPRKIAESAPIGSLIASVTATDVDIDTRLEYSLNPPNPLFVINRFSGAVHLVAPLDYETAKEHRLQIQVSDGENISKSTLIVNVIDENDNAPKFDKDFYDLTVIKTMPIGSAVTKVIARDPDSALAGKLFYNFSTNSDFFQIDNESGLVKVKSPLAPGSVHYLKVQAFDYGLPQQSAAVALRISTTDSADRVQPHFNKKSYSFSIPEDTPPNILIGGVHASNAPGVKFDYRIVETEATLWAHIDHNGDVFLKRQLDREKNQSLKFTVEASSPNSFANATTVVHIQVLDVNDNSPQFFVSTNRIVITEHMRHGEILARISASDRDGGDNGRISYRILSGNDHGMFQLDSASGTLVFQKWNEQAIILSESLEKIVVVAMDAGHPPRWNYTAITILVERESWSGTAPFFALPFYQTSVLENIPVGSVVLKSRAVSRAGTRGTGWEYALKDNDEAFTCNSTTGDIILVRELDFETRNTYEFSLIVKDRNQRSAVVPISVAVLGVDEYPPMFMKSTYTFQIPRSAEVGQRVGAVTATDQDSGIDGVVRYEIEGDALRYLGIDPDSGQIVLTRELTEKIKANMTFDEFVVIASSGTTQHSRVKVFVEIGDFITLDGSKDESFVNPQMLTIASLILLFILLSALVLLIIRMRIRIRKQRKPKKQVYSVSRGNVAVMADLNRLSPKFEYEKQRVPLPSPPSAANNRPPSSSLSRCSDESIRMRQKTFVVFLFYILCILLVFYFR